jgi:hypothetical protein
MDEAHKLGDSDSGMCLNINRYLFCAFLFYLLSVAQGKQCHMSERLIDDLERLQT